MSYNDILISKNWVCTLSNVVSAQRQAGHWCDGWT